MQAKPFPVANLSDLLPLASAIFRAVSGRLEFGPSAILTAWFQQLAHRYAWSGAVMLPLPGKRIQLVVDRDLSIHILSQAPSSPACLPGRLKTQAMELLAPHALTIAHDQQWLQWHPFHEAVLCPGSPHPEPICSPAHDRGRLLRSLPIAKRHPPAARRHDAGCGVRGWDWIQRVEEV